MTDEKPGLVDETKTRFQRLRRRWPFLDHVLAMLGHYSKVQGSVLSGAVTYFGFLSFFPLLALAFAVIGYVARYYPDAEDSLVSAIQQIFPNIVTLHGRGNTISMDQIKNAKAAAGAIGFVGVLYSGLGWLSGLRQSLQTAFEVPPGRKRNFFVGKGVDLLTLVILGLVLIVSVGVETVVKRWASTIIGWLHLSGSWVGSPLVWLIGIVIGIAASTLLFFVMYRLLGAAEVPHRHLWRGALLAAVGFEVLKVIVVNVLGAVGGSPFAPLAVAITLVVWINYFSRLVIYGASWAMTAPKTTGPSVVPVEVLVPNADRLPIATAVRPRSTDVAARIDAGSALIGGAAAAIAIALWRKDR
jgi:membrane protein